MEYFIDVAYKSINKYGEELCGDRVEIIELEDSTIIVMSDGLGSGVKANILASLTTKIVGTLLKEGMDIFETVSTITNTLPVCKVRNIAYSTFTFIKVYKDGRAHIVEYDNPGVFMLRRGKNYNLDKREIVINNKKVYESKLNVKDGDVFVLVSDGAIHAGIGNILNLGWTWDSVKEYLEKCTRNRKCARDISKDLISVCWDLYGSKPGDDTTAVAVKIRKPEYIDIFTGPPEDKNNDKYVIEKLMSGKGKKIICGGTAANIAERELKKKLIVNDDYYCDVPPTATLEGIDLVTEGVLTISKAIDKIKKYSESVLLNDGYDIKGDDGASKLASMLIEECTHIHFWIGKAINPAHQNPSFPANLSIKLNLVEQLIELLKSLGKCVEITYV
ncbi:stage II sporulation protein E (SpoIIE) [Clostridium tepidiprofundi DSM 19306]|uniref:Stage II sporulation protein E (SpoIIE) n=1 Tax=Clostridium tepidiprofundi DSM 19306 TaxID=1121338 RepID=A0A151B3H1_9CLOT|nr:SpoIIE family protein phosphatase [Clostridium tepidiprofundi]KYH34333.1 stage II sporulation protein E (SpoIIE) [Clostridium tepidiprofundi DSM 19306]